MITACSISVALVKDSAVRQQRALDDLPAPGFAALDQGGERAERAVQRGAEIDPVHRGAIRRVAGAGHVDRARHDLADAVEADAVGPSARARRSAVAVVRMMSGLIAFSEVVVELHGAQGLRRQIGDHDVRGRHQAAHHLLPFRLHRIERDAFLVAVDLQKQRALAAFADRRHEAVLAAVALLHADDLGAELGQQVSRNRAPRYSARNRGRARPPKLPHRFSLFFKRFAARICAQHYGNGLRGKGSRRKTRKGASTTGEYSLIREYHVGDHGQMVRVRAKALRSVQAEQDHAVARNVNRVQRISETEAGIVRSRVGPDRLCQHAPHRPHSGPVVAVADHNGSRRLHQVDQRMDGLGVPLMDAQAEVGRNDPRTSPATSGDYACGEWPRRGSRS